MLAYGLVGCLVVWPQVPVDDAFINFRYADNLARGLGAVFNPGERVEGFSSPSWMLVMAAVHALRLPAPGTAMILGLAFGLGTLVVLARCEADRLTRLTAVSLLSLHFPTVYQSMNGLETAAMMFLVTALACMAPRTPRLRVALCAVAGALVLTRPEGALVVLLFAGCAWILGERERWQVPRLLAVLAATLLAQLLVRELYYGDWVANSARAKLLPLAFAWPPGLEDLGRFLGSTHGSPLVAILAVTGVGFAFASAPRDPASRARRIQALFLISLAPLLAVGGGDSAPLWRFYVPIAPLYFLMAGEGLARLSALLAPRRPLVRTLALGAVGLVFAAGLLPWSRSMHGDVLAGGQIKDHWIRIGRALGRAFPPETTIALCPVGAVPYYSRLHTIDMLGLTDPHVARAPVDTAFFYPGHQRHDAAYVLGRRPDLIMLGNGPVMPAGGRGFPWGRVLIYERDLPASPLFASEYEPFLLEVEDGSRVALFGRKDFLQANRSRLP